MTQIVYRIQNGIASERSTVDGHPKRQTKRAEVWAIFTSSTATNICICFAAITGDDAGFYSILQGAAEHGVDAPDSVGGEGTAILRVFMYRPSFFSLVYIR